MELKTTSLQKIGPLGSQRVGGAGEKEDGNDHGEG